MNKWVVLGGIALALAWAPYLFKEWTRQTVESEADAVDDGDDNFYEDEELDEPVAIAALPVDTEEVDTDEEDAPEPEPNAEQDAPEDPDETDSQGSGEPGVESPPSARAVLAEALGHQEQPPQEPESEAQGPEAEPDQPEAEPDQPEAEPDQPEAEQPESEQEEAAEGADEDTPKLPEIRVPQAGPYDLVKGVFEEETRDGLWAGEREAALPGYFEELGFSEGAVSQVTCHRTVCQVQVDMRDRDRAALMTLAVKLTESGGPGLVTSASEVVGERARVTLYLVRDGYTLQDLAKGD